MKMETSGWSDSFSDKLIGIDRLETEGEEARRCQFLLQLHGLLCLLGESPCHCDRDH